MARGVTLRLMAEPLIDLRMADGSRHFGDLPERADAGEPDWDRLRAAVPRLDGATLEGFVCDGVTEAWIDLSWRGHRFSINNQHGAWWFFVADPSCPDETLLEILFHFGCALDPMAARARRAGRMAPGGFRVVVFEADASVTCRDFRRLEEARAYADDAASETEQGVVIAAVFDEAGRRLHQGGLR